MKLRGMPNITNFNVSIFTNYFPPAKMIISTVRLWPRDLLRAAECGVPVWIFNYQELTTLWMGNSLFLFEKKYQEYALRLLRLAMSNVQILSILWPNKNQFSHRTMAIRWVYIIMNSHFSQPNLFGNIQYLDIRYSVRSITCYSVDGIRFDCGIYSIWFPNLINGDYRIPDSCSFLVPLLFELPRL